MTAAEMIEKLKEYPGDTEVFSLADLIDDGDWEFCYDDARAYEGWMDAKKMLYKEKPENQESVRVIVFGVLP